MINFNFNFLKQLLSSFVLKNPILYTIFILEFNLYFCRSFKEATWEYFVALRKSSAGEAEYYELLRKKLENPLDSLKVLPGILGFAKKSDKKPNPDPDYSSLDLSYILDVHITINVLETWSGFFQQILFYTSVFRLIKLLATKK